MYVHVCVVPSSVETIDTVEVPLNVIVALYVTWSAVAVKLMEPDAGYLPGPGSDGRTRLLVERVDVIERVWPSMTIDRSVDPLPFTVRVAVWSPVTTCSSCEAMPIVVPSPASIAPFTSTT